MVEYVDKVDYRVSDYITITSTFTKPMFYEAVDPLGPCGGNARFWAVFTSAEPVRNGLQPGLDII